MSSQGRFAQDTGGARGAVVALESTVISHGLPYPHSLRLASRLEEIVRGHGAEPVTVGITRGEVVVRLDQGQVEHLATAPGVRKVSRRDLPVVPARRHARGNGRAFPGAARCRASVRHAGDRAGAR